MPDSVRNGIVGRPGSAAKPSRMAATVPMTRGFSSSCDVTSLPRSVPDAARVTMMPAAVEISSAGICETRPSPMVSVV